MKSLFAVFSVVLVVLSVGVIATGFGQKPERQATNTMSEKSPPPDREQYRFARLVTAFELTRLHLGHAGGLRDRPAWLMPSEKERELEAKYGRLVADQMLSETAVGAEWKLTIIQRKDQDRKSLSEFEKQAIEKIHKGAEEVGERTLSGVVHYVRPIRMQQKCAECHQPADNAKLDVPGLPSVPEMPSLKVGDVIATLSLEITFKDPLGAEPTGKSTKNK